MKRSPGSPPPGQPEAGATRFDAGALLRRAEVGAARAGPHLLVREPGEPERVVALTADCTVGRGAGAVLRLRDPSASRLHLRLRLDGAGTSAEDLSSRNGLNVNGRRWRGHRRLRSGDELEVGESRLRFVDPLEPPSAAVPQAQSSRRLPSVCSRLALAAGLLLLAALALALG